MRLVTGRKVQSSSLTRHGNRRQKNRQDVDQEWRVPAMIPLQLEIPAVGHRDLNASSSSAPSQPLSWSDWQMTSLNHRTADKTSIQLFSFLNKIPSFIFLLFFWWRVFLLWQLWTYIYLCCSLIVWILNLYLLLFLQSVDCWCMSFFVFFLLLCLQLFKE